MLQRGFLKDGASYTTIDVPGTTISSVRGINSSGQIVGIFYAMGSFHGFFKDGASYTNSDIPGASPGSTRVSGINDAGQIVGDFRDATARYHGLLATPVPEPRRGCYSARAWWD